MSMAAPVMDGCAERTEHARPSYFFYDGELPYDPSAVRLCNR